MKEFEYMEATLHGDHPAAREKALNLAGAQGWELVTVSHSDPNEYPVAYFKREKYEEPNT